MTNKVKPFYIRITDDMTPQMVQDAFDKCVDAGADAEECIADTNKKHNYQDAYHKNFNYFGVSKYSETCLADDHCNYGEVAQEITLDQLDEWLGLEVEQEWRNGDEVEYANDNRFKCKFSGKYICFDDYSGVHVILNDDGYWPVNSDCIRKPETPEQKSEREKKEEAKEMIQCLLDNYTECDDSAVEYVIDYLVECESLGK